VSAQKFRTYPTKEEKAFGAEMAEEGRLLRPHLVQTRIAQRLASYRSEARRTEYYESTVSWSEGRVNGLRIAAAIVHECVRHDDPMHDQLVTAIKAAVQDEVEWIAKWKESEGFK
jgi:hypothetical protein